MGFIRPTPAGTYRAFWSDASGRKHGKTFRKRSDASQWLKFIEGEVHAGTFIDPAKSKVTFAEFLPTYWASKNRLSVGTRDIYEKNLRLHILPTFGHTTLANIELDGTDPIEAWLASLADKGLNPGSIGQAFGVLRTILNVAVRKRRMRYNPCVDVQAPTSETGEMSFLTMEEVVALASSISPRYEAWVYVSALGGLRFSETNALRVKRLDFLRRSISIEEQLLRQGGEWIRTHKLKTATSRRRVVLPGSVWEVLAQHVATYTDGSPNHSVFLNREGNHLNNSSFICNTFRPALIRAGLNPRLRPHDLRHTCVALAIEAGAHPKAIQMRLGHSTIKMTLDRYGHLFPGLDDELADRLGDRLEIARPNRTIASLEEHRQRRSPSAKQAP